VGEQRARRGSIPIGLRILGVGVLALTMTGSGILLDRAEPGPSQGAAATQTVTETGGWFCPHGGGKDWRAWIVVTNPGSTPVQVRATSFGRDRPPQAFSFTVGAERQVYREVPAGETGASTEVEFFGGWVGASSVVRSMGDDPGIAAARCTAAAQPAWYVPDGTTGRGETSYVILMNPFATDAALEITIRTEERQLQPSSLTPYVIRPRSSVALPLNTFALQSPRERTVATRVVTNLGRAVVGGVGISSQGIRAEGGLPVLQTRWNFAASAAQSWFVPVFHPGEHLATVSLLAQTASSQHVVPGLEEVDLDPTTVRTFDVTDLQNNGLAVQSTNRVPVAAAARLIGPGDVATLNGSARAFARWLVLPPLPPEGGSAVLVVSNPRLIPATVGIRLIGDDGPVAAPGLQSVRVGAGRAVVVPFPERLGESPVSAIVESRDGAVVVATTGSSPDEAGYAATQGHPIPG
jgi:hypothetical protein